MVLGLWNFEKVRWQLSIGHLLQTPCLLSRVSCIVAGSWKVVSVWRVGGWSRCGVWVGTRGHWGKVGDVSARAGLQLAVSTAALQWKYLVLSIHDSCDCFNLNTFTSFRYFLGIHKHKVNCLSETINFKSCLIENGQNSQHLITRYF